MSDAANATLTAVPGFRVGHWTNLAAATGCTVVLCPPGVIGGVEVRGGAPGTRETDLLRPGTMVEEIHAVLLSGGSAFGLNAAGGIMRYLEERGIGFPTRAARVPIVPGAVIFDLPLGRPDIRPGEAEGYAACLAADAAPVAEGNVGAGTGALVGKIAGVQHAMKGGLGSARLDLGGGLLVAALIAVNASGDIVDPDTGGIVAGAYDATQRRFLDGHHYLLEHGRRGFDTAENTTIGVVATNARLDKTAACRLASIAHNGFARAIRPAHTQGDGDTLFVLGPTAPAAPTTDLTRLGAAMTEVVARAIVRAVRAAAPLHGVPGLAPAPGAR